MLLEDYFEFEKFDSPHGPFERIRLKGHRVSIENIVEPFRQGVPPDVIWRDYYPSLSLEQVYAAITYYLHNREQLDEYLQRGERVADAHYREYRQKGPFALRDEALAHVVSPPAGSGEAPHE